MPFKKTATYLFGPEKKLQLHLNDATRVQIGLIYRGTNLHVERVLGEVKNLNK